MTTLALLAQLQDHCRLPALASTDISSVNVLVELLSESQDSTYLPFAIAAFLLDENDLEEIIRDGVIAAAYSWKSAARKRANAFNWRPQAHPQVPSAVIRALSLAEASRQYRIAINSGAADVHTNLDLIHALADEWRTKDVAPRSLDDIVRKISEATATKRVIHTPPEWLLSVSIDVAGSTEAKTRLKNLAPSPDRQEQFLEQFYRLFLQKELNFYNQMTMLKGRSGLQPIALEQIFYVKGIGDEVWLLIEPKGFNAEHLLHLTACLLDAAQAVLSSPIEFVEAAIEESPRGRLNHTDQLAHSAYERLVLPLKIFIDKVDGAYPIGEQRAATLLPWLNSAIDDGRLNQRDFATVANRIGAGTGTLIAGTWRNSIRTDYIGHDIDRLFRSAKAARPMLTTVGEHLWLAADPDSADIPEGCNVDRSIIVRCDPRSDAASRGKTYRVRPETIPRRDMKGIGEDYRVFHVFDAPSLRGQFVNAELIRKAEETAAKDSGLLAPQPSQFVSDMDSLRMFLNDPSFNVTSLGDAET